MTASIDSEAVNKAFLDALWREDELIAGNPPASAIIVEGIVSKCSFHPERLESHRAEVSQWLAELPTEFQQSDGGGWSFLNACDDRHGEQWTSFHQRMEQLLCLGIGLKLAAWQLPRELWEILPGGMPYVVIYSAPEVNIQ